MSHREYIKSLVKGADVYRKQGLYEEAKEKYLEALSYISRQRDLSNRELIAEILEKRVRMDENLAAANTSDDTTELTQEMQDIIKDLFSFSGARDIAAFEGAEALMKFGQYKRALKEFEALLAVGIYPMACAKNIITCSLLVRECKFAIDRFVQWSARSLLTNQELSHVRDFLLKFLADREIEAELPCSKTILRWPFSETSEGSLPGHSSIWHEKKRLSF